jgi:hypothetical protein
MATENKGVMVYLPSELEQVIEHYCTENNITRKNKDGVVFPSLGTGIVQYLKSQLLGIEANSRILPSTVITRAEILDLLRENITSTLPSEILSRSDVSSIIQEYFASNVPSDLPTVDMIETEIERALQPLQAKVKELKQVLSELVANQLQPNAENPVADTGNTSSKRQQPQGEPDWVNENNRRYYRSLVGNCELLAKVSDAIDLHPDSNEDLAQTFIGLGFHKQDGTALGASPLGRIKSLVKHLKIPVTI